MFYNQYFSAQLFYNGPCLPDAPELRRLDGPFLTQVGGTTKVPCGTALEANPPPTFQWEQRNPEVISYPSGRFSIVDQTGVMIVEGTRLEDSGVYYCTAINDIGRVTISIELLVLGECCK